MPEPGGSGGPLAPQYLADQLTLHIPTGEGRLSPPITTGNPNVFHLPAALYIIVSVRNQKFPIKLHV